MNKIISFMGILLMTIGIVIAFPALIEWLNSLSDFANQMSSFFNSISKNFQTGQIDLSKFPVLNENIGTIIKQVVIGGFFLFIGIVLLTINLVNKQINIHNKNTNNNHAKATVTNEVSPTIAEQNYEQNGNFGIGHMSDGNINQGAILAGQSNQTEIKKLQETIKELQTKLDQLANNSSSVN